MDWIQLAWGAACIGFGYSLHGLIAANTGANRYKWSCPHCPGVLGSSHKDSLQIARRQHLRVHGVVE